MAILSAGVAAVLLGMAQVPIEAKLKVGDKIKVVVTGAQEYNGEYTVLDDGSVSGVGFGRMIVAGKGITEIQSMILGELKKVLVKPALSVVFLEQRPEYVFVTSVLQGTSGPIRYEAEMDVRTAITGVILPQQTDLYSLRLFRKGKIVQSAGLDEILTKQDSMGSTVLEPNDVLTISEATKLRIYVSGRVRDPGAFQVLEGTDALQAVAIAGGTVEANLNETESVLKVRRGEVVHVVSQDPNGPKFGLESGDTVFVEVPAQMKVYIGGEVRTAQEVSMREGGGLLSALQKTGGLASTGSLKDILVVRGSDAYVVDLSFVYNTGKGEDFPLQDRDLVFIRKNENRVLVLGFAARPGSVVLLENREYHLADILAESGGLGARGSNVRIYVGRAGEGGKIKVNEYRFDKFLKDGDVSQNPWIHPGDVVMVGQSKGLTLQGVAQIMSQALLLNSSVGR